MDALEASQPTMTHTPCNNTLCRSCLHSWFESQLQPYGIDTVSCPLCRAIIARQNAGPVPDGGASDSDSSFEPSHYSPGPISQETLDAAFNLPLTSTEIEALPLAEFTTEARLNRLRMENGARTIRLSQMPDAYSDYLRRRAEREIRHLEGLLAAHERRQNRRYEIHDHTQTPARYQTRSQTRAAARRLFPEPALGGTRQQTRERTPAATRRQTHDHARSPIRRPAPATPTRGDESTFTMNRSEAHPTPRLQGPMTMRRRARGPHLPSSWIRQHANNITLRALLDHMESSGVMYVSNAEMHLLFARQLKNEDVELYLFFEAARDDQHIECRVRRTDGGHVNRQQLSRVLHRIGWGA